MDKRVLVVGSGGREHALAWKLRQSPQVAEVVVTPGNGGTPGALAIAANDLDGIVAAAAGFDLVVVGPEDPLALGLVDRLTEAGILAFGPVAAAAQLEASKAFGREVMEAAGVPSPRWGAFTDAASAFLWLEENDYPVVVKASGLAAGKGVIVCDDRSEALAAVRSFLIDGYLDGAGEQIVIEERLFGEEVSALAFVDGNSVALMPTAQDHKRIFEGDLGPNTGGMGAYAPAPLGEAHRTSFVNRCLRPIVDELARRGIEYRGVLYAGVMLTHDGPKVLEYNCRFGDPETQVILPLLESDLYDVLVATATGRLTSVHVVWREGAALTVVAASEGYPGTPVKGRVISGLDEAAKIEGVTVFHAGTTAKGGESITSGGRVLTITGVADDLAAARDRAYEGLSKIHFEGMQARRDIGWRALQETP